MNSQSRSISSTVRMEWLRRIEQIALACCRENRVVGVTAPHSAAGVSTLSHAFAELSASWGVKTLLVDLSTAAYAAEIERRWTPGIEDPKNFLDHGGKGYAFLQIGPGAEMNIGSGRPKDLLTGLFKALEEYQTIILDLPAVLEYSPYTLSPIVGALSCDKVIIVCSRGWTTSDQLTKTIEVLQLAGARIGGTVLNEFRPSAVVGRVAGPPAL